MKVMMECGIAAVMATRSQDGMSVITSDADPLHIPANVREVFDVSGAGDTVVATFALALSAGVGMEHAAQLANIAAGIVVGKTGTATARPDEMLQVLEDQSAAQKQNKSYTGAKCVSIAGAGEQAERWRIKGGKVGFTNGCFDLLHPGHVSTLQQAKAACDYLVVAINSDSSVKRLKGESRPVQDQNARAAILSALACVDLVVVFEEDTPIEAMKAIRPDILVKGGQYKLEEVVGYDLIASWGGKVVRADMEDGFSTTNTIAKMAG
jgi:D-beta-D-heptose 7-phosphate kinase/D-beta-D-heptose 1-phosphate adenosyltransferase